VTQSAADVSTAMASAPKAPAMAQRLLGTAMPRLIVGLVLLLIWEVAVRLLAPPFVAKPTSVLAVAPHVLSDPVFWKATGSTLLACAEGLAISLILGTVIGLAMGRIPAFEKAIAQHVNFFYAMPMIVILPLFSLWFGYSATTRIATIIFASIFAITMNVADGARSVPREFLRCRARSAPAACAC
jgi:ABC-type nitrate/sulfonate/bicarbonate transport system permease component